LAFQCRSTGFAYAQIPNPEPVRQSNEERMAHAADPEAGMELSGAPATNSRTTAQAATADLAETHTTPPQRDSGLQTVEPAIEVVMRRALELAANGPAKGINPRVGAVILSADGEILAEGWHRGVGTAHAEVDALSQLADGAARGATAVVTLEPCNHTGHTGPCAIALIEAGIGRVVYAVPDPGAHSSGGGDTLRAAGVDVESGVLADEATEFLSDWLDAARLHRPFVTVKWASSLDGRAAASDGSSQWITGPDARADVHRRRAEADAIVVGTGTVLVDDPSLTARDSTGELLADQPIPVVIGTRGIPDAAAIRSHPHAPLFYPTDDLPQVLDDLRRRGIRRVFVEGGPTLASAFVAAGLVDEYLIYLAPTLLGGPRTVLDDIGVATIGDQHRLTIRSLDRLGNDILIVAEPESVPDTGPPGTTSDTVPQTDTVSSPSLHHSSIHTTSTTHHETRN
jgi:diaminohydroxyphosphoribosylaminopyrimidine deaminase / 5-amino-6-(5-phosphoribosylamino)uracil reductase